MRDLHMSTNKALLAFALFSLVALRASAQSTYSQPRINAAVNNTQLTVLHGNTYPLAQPQFDHGLAPANLPMQHMLLILKRSPAQEAALEAFMAQQLDPSSPNYHHWLTPVEFGQMYGPAQQDIEVLTKWLSAQGFAVEKVGSGRTVIQFSGTAAQVQGAFHTAIHQYVVKGVQHWANSSDPSIPTALAPVVTGVRSLHNFYPRPQHHMRRGVRPGFTFDNGEPCDIAGASDDCFAVGPGDFGTIYNVQPLWNNGINGTGETIAIVGDSDINTEDVTQFRSLFGLTGGAVNVLTPDGAVTINDDEIEAALDTEWSGAVATGATIDLVIAPSSTSGAGTFGGDLAAEYIIDYPNSTDTTTSTGLAPILSESFGECELGLGSSGNAFYNTEWQQAAAEGITVLVAAGDDGSAACDIDEVNGPITQPASNGLEVNGVASTPYNVAVGGTDFNDLGTETSYWNQSPGTTSTALKYIPESTWNDSCTNAQVFPLVSITPPITTAAVSCSNATIQGAGLVEVTGGSGGVSNCTTFNGTNPAQCTGGNTQPAWQSGFAGVVGATRNLPDVSLFAGDGFAGSFYVMCEMDTSASSGGQGGEPCALGTTPNFVGVGGTSVSVQAFAGLMALVDQKSGGRQGNAGSVFYPLAATQSNASCNSSAGPAATCFFNDVTVGTNAMPCTPGSLDCSTTASIPGVRLTPAPRITVRAIRIVCALGIGLLLLFGFRRNERRWSAAAAALALVLLVASVGCGGSSSSSSGTDEGTPEGTLTGYNAATGYDLATGLGSVNATNLVDSTLWAGVPPAAAPVTINRPTLTLPIATLTAACLFCLGLLFIGVRRRQLRWTTAVLLVAFALSILSAARSNASTHVGKAPTKRPVAARLASFTGR
jgi:Pro-kumamolisin, activation domain